MTKDPSAVSATPDVNASAVPASRRHRSGFGAAAFAFLIVMAVATLPSPLYGLYRIRDHLSALTITVVFAIFAGGTIAILQRDSSIVARIGRRGTMLGAVATMMAAVGVLALWKDLPGLLIGRLITGVSVGLAAGTAITYLIELRLRRRLGLGTAGTPAKSPRDGVSTTLTNDDPVVSQGGAAIYVLAGIAVDSAGNLAVLELAGAGRRGGEGGVPLW